MNKDYWIKWAKAADAKATGDEISQIKEDKAVFYGLKRRRPCHGVRLNVWGDNTSAVIS